MILLRDERDIDYPENLCGDYVELSYHESLIEAKDKKIESLENKLKLALDYIDKSPCDYAMYADQLEAWSLLQDALNDR